MNLAPNGKPSNLNAEQYKLVRTSAFKKWFGDWENEPKNASKVVDENGEPLVVYHRSKKKFYFFDIEKQLNGWLGKGFYFSENKSEFKEYGGKLFSVFLNVKNPFVVVGQSPSDFLYELNQVIISDKFDSSQKLKENGFDGVIYKHWDYQGKMFTCFIPNQIKLADGSNTTFDADNEDIRYENGGTIDNGKANFSKPLDFDEWIFIHETNEEDAKSILENGFRPNKNEVITNGVYTIPQKWKDTKVGRGGVELKIKLKPNKKIFWTDSNRPMDFEIGYGNKFFVKLYKKLNKGEISPYEAYIVRGDRELWFEKKAVFSRKMENWLKENNYVGIQQGGEVVLTDLSGFTITNKLEFGGKILNWNYSIGGL
jgi:hypothetical protein